MDVFVFIAVYEPHHDNGTIKCVAATLEDILLLYPDLEFDIKHSPWRDDDALKVVTAAKWQDEVLVIYRHEVREP